MLWGEVGLLSLSELKEAGERISDGEALELFNSVLVSVASALSVNTLSEGRDGEGKTWTGCWKGSDAELTADVSMVMVGARSRRRGVFGWLEPSPLALGSDMMMMMMMEDGPEDEQKGGASIKNASWKEE